METGLDFDENVEEPDGSDGSGSDFQGSDEDEDEDDIEDESDYEVPATRRLPKKRVAVEEDDLDEDEESEAEEAMIGAAIQESIRTARNETAGVSSAGASSSSFKPRLSGPAARAAAAAEKRLGLARSVSVEDFASALGAGEDEVLEISDDEPLATKTKAKCQSNGKGKTKIADTSKPKVMTLAEQKRLRREARAKARLEKNSTKAEEKALRAKLGRRLTYVGFNISHLHGLHLIASEHFCSSITRPRNLPFNFTSIIPSFEMLGGTWRPLWKS